MNMLFGDVVILLLSERGKLLTKDDLTAGKFVVNYKNRRRLFYS